MITCCRFPNSKIIDTCHKAHSLLKYTIYQGMEETVTLYSAVSSDKKLEAQKNLNF